VQFSSFGQDFDGTKTALRSIACHFHWFGNSICNLARLAGFIRAMHTGCFTRADLNNSAKYKTVKNEVDGYVDGVRELADVKVWRDKVGAHFAITDPRKTDNVATLDMSVIFPVTISKGRYFVGEFQMTRRNSTWVFTSEIPSWSVTEVFEAIFPRYWPGMRFGPLQEPECEWMYNI
jgi:hypothetical protein